jgi:hypothetical protein
VGLGVAAGSVDMVFSFLGDWCCQWLVWVGGFAWNGEVRLKAVKSGVGIGVFCGGALARRVSLVGLKEGTFDASSRVFTRFPITVDWYDHNALRYST